MFGEGRKCRQHTTSQAKKTTVENKAQLNNVALSLKKVHCDF